MARALDVDLEVPWEVTVVSSERRPEGLRTRIRRALWAADVLIGSCPEGLVVAVHRSSGTAEWSELGRGVVCGVGDTHPDARGLRASYEEALEALQLARRQGLRVLRFDDAWFDRFLLGAVSAEELAEVVLAPIAGMSRNRRAAVLETLEAYLDSGSSVAAVADALHLHRQSVNYRMQNIRKLFGERLRSPHGRLALHIAVKATRLQRN
jgi:DNA-binding PucR family transcriptional regulator